MMAACGFWLSTNRLGALLVDDDARPAHTLRVAMNDDERWAILEYFDAVHGLDCSLLLPEHLLKAAASCRLALARGHHRWLAPRPLVQAIRAPADLATRSRITTMIARLAIVPALRGLLRRIDRRVHDFRQLPLL
ncbi:MAG TPA: hypothetical protein VI669_03710 [Vicinamibacteria bacterium]